MHRPSHLPNAFLLAVVAVSVFAASRITAQPPQVGLRALVSDSAALYTEEQAGEGQAVWSKTCMECHESSDVTGADFRTKWVGQPLFTLYEQIRTTMPDGDPGTLSREEYAATLAYILKLNGLPAGETRLAADSVVLSAITLTLPSASTAQDTVSPVPPDTLLP